MSDRGRLLELLGALSLASDAADGFPPETTVRAAVLAAAIAAGLGDEQLVSDVLYGALIRHIGCTAFAVEEARRYGAGDDVGLRTVMAAVDFGMPDDAVQRITSQLAADAPPAARAEAIANLLGDGPAAGAAHDAAQCDAAERLAALLPLSAGARSVATDAFERWDGYGGPAGKAGVELSAVARIVEVAAVAELFRHREGRAATLTRLASKSGHHLDPDVVDHFCRRAGELFALVEDPTRAVWDRLLDAEPEPTVMLSPSAAVDAATAFGRFTDLKSRWFVGHSEAVAALAVAAAGSFGLDDGQTAVLRRAGLLHDLGRVAIPTGVWELPRPLSRPERDRMERHAAETGRILASSPLFDDVATIVCAAHERIDGSGYPRAVAMHATDAAARLLAAADMACALAEHRPHRPPFARDDAARILDDEVTAGRLDRSAVAAVLDVGGGPVGARLSWPAGLSDREVQVLRLVATGATNKDIAGVLGITPKTVAHHVAHVYTKANCRSRAGATLFALDAGLVGPAAAPA